MKSLLERQRKLYDRFHAIAENKTREFLIEKIDSMNYISAKDLEKRHKKNINAFWANMMVEKATNAISRF